MKTALGLLGCLLMAGCAPEAPLAEPQPEVRGPSKLTTKPDFDVNSRLGILVASEPGRKIRVGDAAQETMLVFPRSASAQGITELPPTLALPYRVSGWEDKTGGFAVVVYDGKVALAMRRSMTDPQELRSLILAYTDAYGEAQSTEGDREEERVRFWFWEDSGQRLMVTSLTTKEGATHLTEAVGTMAVMSAVGANPVAAKRHRSEAARKMLGTSSGTAN